MKKILITIVILPLFSFGQIISQYVETNTGSHPKLIEIYNNTGATLNFDESSGGKWLYVKYRANGGTESNKEIIKTGSLARSERVAKYNQLIRIEEELGKKARMNKIH